MKKKKNEQSGNAEPNGFFSDQCFLSNVYLFVKRLAIVPLNVLSSYK